LRAPAGEPAETYRRAELRLRLLLLGDGIDSPGRVRGEEYRGQVVAELRRMRNAFDAAVLAGEEARAEKVAAGAAGLEEELQAIATSRSLAQHASRDALPALVTPAEAAQALRMSVGSIYRAVPKGEIRAVRLTDKKRGALRIPASELERLLGATPASAS
jgi:excisionase family DNA binding protein